MRLKDVSTLSPRYIGDPLDAQVSFVPMEGLRNGKITCQEIPFNEAYKKYTYFRGGDLLVAKVTPCFENGNISVAKNLLNGIGFGSSEFFVLRAAPRLLNSYLFYVTQSSDFKGRACSTMCGVGGLKRISPLFMRTYEMNVPLIDEQKKIVGFLDAHLSRIDKTILLLSKKKDAYLKLKKSIIDKAVTRGLDDSVNLKDSGIDWIGKIPETWSIKRYKDIINTYSTGITPPSKNDEYFNLLTGYTWITISDLMNKFVDDSELKLSEKAIEKYSPTLTPKGSLVFSFKLSIGKMAFVSQDCYTNEAIISIPPINKVCLNFLYYALPKHLYLNATENIYGAKMLNQKLIANMKLAVPPITEQQAIADDLDEKCAKIDSIVKNLETQIEKYNQLKKSLIDEVITGKRKV